MDSNSEASKSKSSKTENNKASEVVVLIPDNHLKASKSVNFPQNMSCPSQEISSISPSPGIGRPPKIPTPLSRRKSRFGEPSIDYSSMFDENGKLKTLYEVVGVNLRTRGGVEDEDENEKICEKVNSNEWLMVQCVLLLCILGFIVSSLTVDKLQHVTIWGFEIWKWCVLVTVALFGLLVTNLLMEVAVLMVQRRIFFTKKVFNFVHSLRSSFQVFVWLSLVLTTWILLFVGRGAVNTSPIESRVFNYITRTLISFPIGALLWLSKTMLLKIFTSSLHATYRFDRIHESILHQYILQKLSRPPVTESKKTSGMGNNTTSELRFQRIMKKRGKEKKGKLELMDMNEFYKIKREGVSAGTMILLVDIIQSSRMTTTIPKVPKQIDDTGEAEQAEMEITNETEANIAAYHIFQNVAQRGCNCIHEMDLRRFLTLKEMDKVFPLFEETKIKPIGRKDFTDWVVKIFKDRQALVHALDDTKTAARQLGKLASGVLIIGMVIVWLLFVEITTIRVLFLLASQLLVAALIFGNCCKTTFEAIIFIFIMHPYDVGDRCVIDGVQMIVEEMNILTTVFLRFDNEKIYYPNSVLASKPISNFNRSPHMGDSLEFYIDFTTPLQKIEDLKEKLKKYWEKNSLLWHPNHSVVVEEIKNVNKLKMALNFTHTMNFQNYKEKSKRRSELVLEMKRIFEDLGIKYNLPLQEVHLVN